MTLDITCPKCTFSKTISKDKIPDSTKFVICPQCRNRFGLEESNPNFAFTEKPQDHLSNIKSSRTESPWEDRSATGTWSSIFRTFRAVLFSPKKLFQSMSYNKGIREPFAFGLLMGSSGIMIALFWQFLNMSSETFQLPYELPVELPVNLIFLIAIIISPLFITIYMFVFSSIIHICLIITRGANNGFEGTFRVLSFSQATQVLGIIPIAGGLIAFIWNIIILFTGLREIHETSYTRVIAAFLIFILLIILITTAAVLSASIVF